MALNVAAVRAGLAFVINAGTGLPMSAWEVDSVSPPCGFVAAGDPFMPEPFEAMRDGLCQIELIVRVIGGQPGSFSAGVQALDQYMGSGTGQTKSVLDAIYDDTTLNGAIPAGNIRAVEVSGIRSIEMSDARVYVGFEIPVRIFITRT